MTQSNAVSKQGIDARWAVIAVAVVLALACAIGSHLAWAEQSAEDDFGEISDAPAAIEDAVGETPKAADPAGFEDAGAVGETPRAADSAESEDADAASTEEPPARAVPQEQDDGGEAALAGEFAQQEYTVEVGQTVAVGFLPKGSDADSGDEARAKWYAEWKAYAEENAVDLSSESGWLVAKGSDGNVIDYDGITGITTSDKAVFDLFGEFPDWKTDDNTGVEYRWWYGLLGKAQKAGDVTLAIVYRQADGTDLVAAECTVHVVEPKKDATEKGDDAADGVSPVGAGLSSQNDSGLSDGSKGGADAQATDNEGPSGVSSTGGASTTASGGTTATASGLSSTASSVTGSGLSSSSGVSSGTGSAGLSSKDAKGGSGAASDESAYPKELCATAPGEAISASLLADDAASEEAFKKLSGSGEYVLVVQAKDKLGDEAEKSLAAIANTGKVQIAKRYAVSVVDSSGKTVNLSGMKLTVKISADDAVKALDAKSVQVWYAAEDGSTEQRTAKLESGFLSFQVEHLSDYVVMGAKDASGSGAAAASTSGLSSSNKSSLPSTGDGLALVAVALAFVAGFSASSALNARRRMREKPMDFGPLTIV